MRPDREEARRLMRQMAMDECVVLFEDLPRAAVTFAKVGASPKRKKSRTPHKHRGRPF